PNVVLYQAELYSESGAHSNKKNRDYQRQLPDRCFFRHAPQAGRASAGIMRAMSRSHTSPETLLQHARGTLTLRRWPRRRGETLRAWDGADLYLLDLPDTPADGPTLVLNDNCGALA